MMKKTLSLFLSLCIINLVCADIYAGVPSPINTVVPADNIIVSDSFIPVDLGVIVDDIYVGSDKTIINIQDLHADESTQKNIVSILEYLTANYNVGTIYLEGAVKELNFDWLKVIKDEKLRNNVAQKLLSDGKITGAEFFGLYNQNEKVKFYGLEDEKVYKENFAILAKMYENKDIMQNKISEVNGYLNDAKKIVYNFGLKALDKLVEAHNDGIISVEKYYSILLKFAKKKQIPYYRYGTIARYLALQKKYGKINSKKLNSQISSIDRSLSGKMEYTQYSKLKQLSQNFPLEYCKQLRANLRTFDVQEEYNEFYKFCDYLEETNKINLQNLLSEGNSVLRDLYSAYSITLAQQHLTFLSDYTERLSACFTNEITSSDYQYISDNFKKYCILSENFVPYTDIVQIKMWYKFVDKFYSNNEKRNKLFLENIYKKKINEEDLNKQIVIKNENRLPFEEILNITKQPIDIVITGGYHSRGMKSLMEDIDVNYAIIMPNIRSANIEESKNKFYADFMKQASILNNTYNKLVLSGNLGENWADPLKSTVDFFLNYDLLQEIYKYYDNKELSKETVASIQEYIEDKFSDKEYKSVLEDISVNEKGDFILKFLSNGKIRVFTVSKEKEVKGKIATRKNGFPFSSILSAFIYGFTLVFGLAFGTIGGGGYAHLRARVSGQEGDDIVEPLKSSDEQNGLVNNGAKTSINGEITFVGTTFGKDADVSLYGNILLNRVVVGEGNKLRVVSSPKTTIIIEDIDLTDIGELNIDIQAEGEFKVVREDGIIKIYKILKTDFSNHNKQNFELVSVLNKGEIVVSSETEWEIKNKYPIIVLYEQNATYWGKKSELEKRSDIIYKGCKVIYLNTRKIKSVDSPEFEEFLQENGISGKDICIDCGAITERSYGNFLYGFSGASAERKLQNEKLIVGKFNSITFLSTDVSYKGLYPSVSDKQHRVREGEYEMLDNKKNEHNYIRNDGAFIRYPYKDHIWLKSVLDELLPESKLQKTTFMCVWPIQSARYTVDGRPRDRYHRVDDKFISFINSVKKYHKKGRDTMIFVPRYLKQEMAAYFKDEDILSKFSEISYFNSDNKKQTIEMLKKDGLTIIMYDGGMRGVHNEQAYIESVTSAYNDGSRNFNSMLTQAGYKWKGNIIYFYEGKEIGTNEDDENVNETIENAIKESLKKPYIKKGKVQYIIDILRKAFKTYRGLRKNINRYMRGNWINVFTVMQENINLVGPEEIMSANKALGFNSISVIPIKKSLLSEQNYKKAETFEKNGETISIYTVKQKSGTIYLVGIENSNTQWQDVALLYIKKDTSLKDGFFNSIISFDGEPQLSYGEITSESYFGSKYIPVVVGGKTKKNKAEERGYIFVDDMKDLHLATSDPKTKYSNFEKDISSAYRNQKIMKAIEQKSLFKNLNKFYVGFKIATDEHVLRPEEYNGFIKSMEFSPVNFITAVVRDNDLSTHVDKDKNSVKENLIKLSKDLHQKDIKFLLEYTFGFFDESFDDFVRTIGQDVKDIGVDGIKIDMVDCSVEQFGKVLKDFETLLKNLKQVNSNIFFTVQVSDEVWQEYQNFFERLNITKTNSSKDELFFERRNISIKGKTNNEISPYENLAERESQLFMMQSLNQSLSIDGYNSDFDRGRKNIGADNNTLLDKRLTYRLIDMLEKYVNDESVGTLTLPMNLFYLKENNENPIIIQAIYALMYHFIEQRVLQDKMRIAYDFGSKQDVILSAQQEEDIAEILRGEGDISAETYVIEHFPQVFDYSIETETSIKAISDSFLYGIYEANIIRRYKEGDFGKVLKFVKQLFADSPDVLEQRQQTFYKLLTHIVLFKDRMNIKDVFSVSDEEFVTYNDQTEEGKILNNYIKALASNWDMRGRLEALEQMLIGFEGYTKNRESSVYIARLLIDGLLRAYKTEEIEPLPKEIVIEDVIDIDIFEQENDTLIMDINNMLSNA